MEEDSDAAAPESPIKIVVTEDETDKKDEEASESKAAEGNELAELPTKDENQTPDSEATTNDVFLQPKRSVTPRRGSVALQEMDKEHAWLSEVEEKSANLETAFISKIQYVALSNHFQKYLKDLESSPPEDTTRVLGEFTNLFDKFRTCFVGSQRLHNKLFELKSSKAMTDSENRKLKINLYEMEQEVDGVSKHMERMRLQEVQHDKDKLKLQKEVNDLKEEMEKASKNVDEQDSDEIITRIVAEDDSKNEEKIRSLQEDVESLRADLGFGKEREIIFQNKLSQADKAKTSLSIDLTSTKSELQRQITLREKAELMVSESTEQLEKKRELIEKLTKEILQLKSELESSQTNSKSLLKELRKSQKEHDVTTENSDKLRKDLDIREDRLKALAAEIDSLGIEIKNKHAEIHSLKIDKGNISKQRQELVRKVAILETKNKELDAKVQNLQEQSASQQKMVNALENEHKENEGKIKELTKQKDGLVDGKFKLESTIIDLRSDVKTSVENLGVLRKEIESSRQEIETFQDVIKRQEKSNERMVAKALELNKTISAKKSEIKTLELRVSESEKVIGELRYELNEELVKYKTLSDDEKFFRKSCADSRRVIEQQSEQLTMLNKHIFQLKNYNRNLDEQRKKLVVDKKNVSDQLGGLTESLKQEIKNGESMAAELKHKDNEVKLLQKKIAVLELDVRDLQGKLKNVTEEKDVLRTKIKEREDQIAASKERMRLLEHDVALLEKTLSERVNDVKLLKLQLSDVYRSHALKKEQVKNMETTQKELSDVRRELQEEKLISKEMEVEMQRPINFHRWRILEGTDPDRAELVAKTQSLQKQLIKKTDELEAKDMELREKEQLADGLRNMVKRRSDNKVEEQLMDCKRELRARMSRLKCLTAENNMYENHVGKYRHEVMALRDELRKFKMAEYDRKTRPKGKKTLTEEYFE